MGISRAQAWIAAACLAAAALTGCGPHIEVPAPPTDPAIAEREAAAFVDGMRPRRAGTPVIAVLALNEGTETTDFLLTHAVLRRAGIAQVQAVAPRAGKVSLYPALQVDGAMALADFDLAHPQGADYVIVPAMSDPEAPALAAWLRRQAERGARVIGVCVGAVVVAHAGLLDHRRFATHWHSRKDVLERHPTAVYVPHQRYVVDRGVATTTGITASVPAMLALVEAIAGRAKAQALADEIGAGAWTPAHDSTRFGLTFGRAAEYLLNKAAFWRREDWKVEVRDGIDDIALAFAADAWSRTGRVDVAAVSPTGPVKLRSGLVLDAATASPADGRVPLDPALTPMQQLDRTLCRIGELHGSARRDWVMQELEYPVQPACAA